jgi:malate dehydrogenase (oxaloacetate-decarboxylating)(NADP+)
MNEYKEPFAVKTEARTLAEAMVDADVFVGLSIKGIVTRDMVASMAADPIIFALANPDPEILPEEVAEVRDDAIMATGRSDYPNQVNNVLGFPFIFRGALDVRAKAINADMMLAATRALAGLTREEVPDTVRGAYDGSDFAFGREYLIPKPFDHRVLFHVAPAVAAAAIQSGVATADVDLEEYRERLKASLSPGREVMRWMTNRARRRRARVVFPEGHNDNVIRAAAQLLEDRTVHPILLGRAARIQEKADGMGVKLDGVEIIYGAEQEAMRHAYAKELFRKRARKGLTLAEAQWNLYKPIYFGASMVEEGQADALVAGVEANYPEILRPVLEVIGVAEGVKRVAGLELLAFANRELMFFADTTVNIEPDAETLADTALQTAKFVRDLGIRPRIAMVSFSNFGSAQHSESRTVAAAVGLVREADPDLEIDGEMQADTAVDARKLNEIYPFSHLGGPANVLVFSRLSAANSAYKLLHQLGGADTIGPILLGMNRPVHILQRGGSVMDIVNLTTIAAVDWQSETRQV